MRRCSGIAASLFMVATGCGGGGDQLPDGPPSAADGEPLPPDAIPLGPVTVTTRTRCCAGESGALLAGIDVILVDADGVARPAVATGADGVARFEDVARGAAVTAIYPATDFANAELVTVLGVAPGDELQFGEHYYSERTGVAGEASISWPSYPGAMHYNVVHPCGNSFVSAATSMTMMMYEYCQVDVADIRLLALDLNYLPLASTRVVGAPYMPGTALTLTEWTTAAGTVTAHADGFSAGVDSQVYIVLRSTFSGGQPWYSTGYGVLDPDVSLPLPLPADGDQLAGYLEFRNSAGGFGRQQRNAAAAGDATTLDLSPHELPWVGDSVFDLTERTASWTQEGSAAYDGAVVNASWYRPDDGGEGGTSYGWKVLIPAGVTSWSWADAPAALADLLPAPDDSFDIDLQIVDLAAADGYDGLRQVPEWVFSCPSCAADAGDLTTAADVSFSYDGGEGFALGARRPHR